MPDSEPDAGTVPPPVAAREAIGSRTHPLTGLVQGVLWAGAAMFALLGQLAAGGDGEGLPIWVDVLMRVGGGLVVGVTFGFLTWWFTRYLIDGTELRITSGILQKSSRRIPYERIQSVDIAEPFLARIIGLAELRIEMAGGKSSRTSLRYLPLEDARRLRRLLLGRAHGRAADELDAETAEPELELIAHVSPGRVVLGTVLSLDFLGALVGLAAVLVAAIWFDQVIAFLGGIIPLLTWLGQIVSKRVLAQWDFTLTRSDTGLRIERGMLSRTSQSIPFARVQGVALEEPYVWRRLGWQRLEVDVAGYASQGSSDSSDSSSTLLPIADPELAAAVLDELVPGAQSVPAERVLVPRRSWPFAPIGWRYRWVAADDVAFVARSGWLERTTDVVPHARTQSVELRQGPWQRRLGVATVEIHTPKGPVDADGPHLDAADAHRVAFAQLARARQARAPRPA
ncbi:PH domain-containing protein [Aeromicrobium sp.]|uniref:PH domain-containing protein n=1 Tax=Aeromicrobium sp. TaxID=1871063 RepID=UPI003C4F9C9D